MGAPQPPVKRWSYSALTEYETCPYRTYLKRVQRSPEPPRDETHPAERGNRIHAEAEAYIRGEGAVTKDLRKVAEALDEARAEFAEGRVEVEEQWGFTREWESVGWDHSQCWALVKCDVVIHRSPEVLEIWDWKSGKSFGNEVKHTQQMQLYGLAGFLRYPDVSIVKVALQYLDEGKTKPKTYDRTMVPGFLPRWEQRANRLTNALVFPPKPNKGRCKYCPYGIENGTGACAYVAGDR